MNAQHILLRGYCSAKSMNLCFFHKQSDYMYHSFLQSSKGDRWGYYNKHETRGKSLLSGGPPSKKNPGSTPDIDDNDNKNVDDCTNNLAWVSQSMVRANKY